MDNLLHMTVFKNYSSLINFHARGTSINKRIQVNIIKRFYPGLKEIGHAKTVINLANKALVPKPPVTNNPLSIAPFNNRALVFYQPRITDLIPYQPRVTYPIRRQLQASQNTLDSAIKHKEDALKITKTPNPLSSIPIPKNILENYYNEQPDFSSDLEDEKQKEERTKILTHIKNNAGVYPENIQIIFIKIAQQIKCSSKEMEELITYYKDNPNKSTIELSDTMKSILNFLALDKSNYSDFILKILNEKTMTLDLIIDKYKKYIENTDQLSEKDLTLFQNLKIYVMSLKKDFEQNTKIDLKPENMLDRRLQKIKELNKKRLFTLQDKQTQKQILTELQEILKTETLSLKQFFEALKQIGIIKYPDVTYKEYYFRKIEDDKYELHYQEETFEEGETAKVDKEAYEENLNKMDQNQNLFTITSEELEKIKKQIEDKDFKVGKLKIGTFDQALIPSGIQLHLICQTPDPSNTDYLYVFASFTSSKDGNTIQLSKTQEINDNPNEQNKPQMIRFHQRLIRIKKEDFIELKKATKYTNEINKEGENVHQKIIQGFINNLIDYQSNSISGPTYFTQDLLKIIAEKQILNLLKDLDEDIKNTLLLQKDVTNPKASMAEKQKRNYLKEDAENKFKQSLNAFDKTMYKILKKLEYKQKDNNSRIKTTKTEPIITTFRKDQNDKKENDIVKSHD